MWIKLTKTDSGAALVNFQAVTHVVPRAGGGSTIYLEGQAPDKTGVLKQRSIPVKEAVVEIHNAIQAAAGGGPAPVSKTRLGK